MEEMDWERQGGQALLATYVQMTRYAQLARELQRRRERSLEQRLDAAVELEDVVRLQQQLEAQQGQTAALEGAAERLELNAAELSQFGEVGVTFQDFEEMGLGELVKKEDVEAAWTRRGEAREDEDVAFTEE